MNERTAPQAPEVLLLVDDVYLQHRQHVRRTFHQPVKSPNNPILYSGQAAWDAMPLLFGSVRYDPLVRRYRMWYLACGPASPGANVYDKAALALAESRDGIAWRRINADMISHRAGKRTLKTNLLLQSTRREHFIEAGSILIDVAAESPKQYMMTYCAEYPGTPYRRVYRLAWSADGIRWRRGATVPCQPPAVVDRHAIVYDQANDEYLLYLRGARAFQSRVPTCDRYERTVCLQTSRDLRHWSDTVEVMAADANDPPHTNIYSLMAFFRGRTLVGIYQRHHLHEEQEVVTTHLCWSHDRTTWHRRQDEFIPLGEPGQWDRFNNAAADQPLMLGDTLVFYYSGRCLRHGGYAPSGREDNGPTFSGIGLATMKLDRFASLSASFDGGWVRTKPMLWPAGKRLALNADCRWGRVDITYGRHRADPVTTTLKNVDGVHIPVPLYPDPSDKPGTLTVTLTNASLYALYFQ